jgi:hypothetical protein
MDKRFADDKGDNHPDADPTTDRMIHAASAALSALPPRSREARAIRAVLGAAGRTVLETAVTFGTHQPHSDEDQDTSDEEHDHQRLTEHAYRRSRTHFRLMACGGTLVSTKFTRISRQDAAVQSVVDFVYRSDNTTTLSWGTTRVKVGDKVEVIQARNRLQTLGRLWAIYDREMTETAVVHTSRVKRTAFYELAGAITARDLKVCAARSFTHTPAFPSYQRALQRAPTTSPRPLVDRREERVMPRSCGLDVTLS